MVDKIFIFAFTNVDYINKNSIIATHSCILNLKLNVKT